MQDFEKIELTYLIKIQDILENFLISFYRIKENNKESPFKLFRFWLFPYEYLDNNKKIKDEYIFLTYVILLPHLRGNNPGEIHGNLTIDEIIEFAEASKDYISKKIMEIRFPLKKNTEETKAKQTRLKLNKLEKEILNDKILDEVTKYIDEGKGGFKDAFKDLSIDSSTLFNYKLTPDQIKGRYERTLKKNPSHRRNH